MFDKYVQSLSGGGIAALVIIFVIGSILFQVQREKKLRVVLLALARRLGWAEELGKEWHEVNIHGLSQGREVKIRQYEAHSRYENEVFGEISLPVKTGDFDFTLKRVGVSQRLFTKLGDVYEKTGDAGFDRVWQLITYDDEALQALLAPPVRAKLVGLAGQGYVGRFELKEGRLSYREDRSLTNAAFLARVEGLVGFLTELTEAAEVTVQLVPPLEVKRDAYGDPVDDEEKKDDDWGEASPDYDRRP